MEVKAIDTLLDHISRSATTVNSFADSANRFIGRINESLAASGIGLPIVGPEIPELRDEGFPDFDVVTRLVYAKVEEGWAVAIQRENRVKDTDDVKSIDGPFSLLACDRNTRIAALAHIEPLLKMIDGELKSTCGFLYNVLTDLDEESFRKEYGENSV